MLQEARAHQVSRIRMVALYGGLLLALVGFALDSLAGLAPDGAFFVAAGVLLALAASLRAGRSLASRAAVALLGIVALLCLALASAAALAFALSDFTLVIQGETSPVQVSDGIGAISALAILGLALAVFAAGALCARLSGPLRHSFSWVFDTLDALVARPGQPVATVQFVALGHSPLMPETTGQGGQDAQARND